MSQDEPSGDTFVLSEEHEAPKKSFIRHRRINVWKSVLRHKKVAFLTVVLVAGLAEPVLYLRSIRPIYRSEAVLLIAPIMLKNVIEDREYQVPRYDELVNEQLSLAVREEVTIGALERLKDDRILWATPGESAREAAGRLSSALIAKRVPDSTYISIALESSSSKGLAPVVNAVVDSYLARVKGKGFYGQEVREETLHQRKTELQEELRKKTDQLSRWAKDLGVAGFDKSLDPAASGSKPWLDARSHRMEVEARWEALKIRNEALRKSDLSGEARDLLGADSEILGLKAVLLPKKNELKAKSMGLTAEHEGRREIERLIQQIDQDLERSEKSALDRIRTGLIQRRELRLAEDLQVAQSDVEQARRFEETLGIETEAQAEKIAKFNSLYYEAMNVRQDVDRLSKQLGAVEDRMDALRMEAQGPGFVTLVSSARDPEKPVKRPMLGIIAGFAALAAFMALALPTLIDALDQRVQSPIDVEFAVDARPLGWILERNPRTNAFVEDQLRRLALSLERSRRIHQRAQLAFMSLRPGGGTTQLVLDIARELRSIGSRVVVIEANALHPDGRYMAPKGHPGLVEALAGSVRVEDAVLPPRELLPKRMQIGTVEGMTLLPNSRNLRAVIDHLSTLFDMVLVDAPPLLFSSDAELIASSVQGVVLVVEAGKVVTGEVRRSLDIIKEIGPLMIEVVVNRVRDYRGHGYYSDLVKQYENVGRTRTS